MLSSKVDFAPFRHSVLDTESSYFRYFWIPAFAGMTVLGLLTSSSRVTGDKIAPSRYRDSHSRVAGTYPSPWRDAPPLSSPRENPYKERGGRLCALHFPQFHE